MYDVRVIADALNSLKPSFPLVRRGFFCLNKEPAQIEQALLLD